MKAFIDTANTLYQKSIPFLFIVDFECQKPIIIPVSEIDDDIEFVTPLLSKRSDSKPQKKEKDHFFEKFPIDQNTYENQFDIVMHHLQRGDSFLTNLTCKTPVLTNATLSNILSNSNAPYSLKYKDEFVVFSPESFIKIQENKIYTFPMKGTIDADIEGAADILRHDPKESAEHATVVDLLRNDLSIVARKVKVDRYKYMDLIKTTRGPLLQMSSQISGTIKKEYQDRFGDLLAALLPAGSICGAPKRKTVEIIGAAEGENRGYYTGVFGIFDGTSVDSAVMIRYIEQDGDQKYYRSGGGITFQSDMTSEYQEMIEKVYLPQPMIKSSQKSNRITG